MLDVYRSEMKKIWKKPIHKVCMFLFLVFCIILSVSSYQRYFQQSGLSDASITIDGQTYRGFAAIKEIDKIHHDIAMRTDVMDMAWYEQLQEDVKNKQLSSMPKEIDAQQMQNVYGSDWQEAYAACQKQTLTYQDFHNQWDKQQHAPEDIVPIDAFPLFYTQASQEAEDVLRKLYLPAIPYAMLDKEHYLLNKDKIEEALQMNQEDPLALTSDTYPKTMLPHIQRSYSDAEITYMNERFLQAKTIFDAKQGYEYFLSSVQNLETYLPMGLLLLMILLSGIFNQEYSAKTDQLLHAVEIGSGKQAIAKIAVGMTFALLFCGLSLLCILGIPWVMIGFYSLDQITIGMPITLFENMVIFVLKFMVSCFSYGAIFLCISSYAPHRFISFIGSGIWMLISCFLGMMIGDSLYFFLPGSFMGYPFDQEIISMFSVITLRSYVIILVWLLLSCFFLYLSYRHYKHREITNA